MERLVSLLPVVAMLLMIHMSWADSVTPDVVVKDTTNQVLDALKSDHAFPKVPVENIVEVINQAAMPHFDLEHMTRIAMGSDWQGATPDQREAIQTGLQQLFTHTLSSALSHYDGQPLTYMPLHMKPDDTLVEVTVMVQMAANDYDAVAFSMEKTDDGWKIYDLTYEGVSMAKNYHSQFSSLIRQVGVTGLIQKLEQKNNIASASKSKN